MAFNEHLTAFRVPYGSNFLAVVVGDSSVSSASAYAGAFFDVFRDGARVTSPFEWDAGDIAVLPSNVALKGSGPFGRPLGFRLGGRITYEAMVGGSVVVLQRVDPPQTLRPSVWYVVIVLGDAVDPPPIASRMAFTVRAIQTFQGVPRFEPARQDGAMLVFSVTDTFDFRADVASRAEDELTATPVAVDETQRVENVLFRTRYRAGLRAMTHVLFEGAMYRIAGLETIGRRRFMEFTAVRT